jgi:hypothetical protein
MLPICLSVDGAIKHVALLEKMLGEHATAQSEVKGFLKAVDINVTGTR